MPKFIIERVVPGASKLTDAEIREASLKSLETLRKLGPEIQRIHSFITDDEAPLHLFSPDETLIEEHGRWWVSRSIGSKRCAAGRSRELQRRGIVTSAVVSA